MQTTFDVLKEILRREFDIDLSEWIRDNLDKSVWKKVRFVADENETEQKPSSAIIDKRRPTLDLVDGFSRYETSIRQKLSEVSGEPKFQGSTLDVVMKTLANSPGIQNELIREIPFAYKLRNRVIHGEKEADEAEVKKSLQTLDEVIKTSA